MFDGYWNVDRLHRLISSGFEQFRLKTALGVVYQGEIDYLEISKDPKNIKIHFKWLCEMRSFSGDVDSRLVAWFEITNIDSKFLTVAFKRYYPQRERKTGSKPLRKQRIKIKDSLFKFDTRHDEECWFYKSGDPESLRKVGDRYLTESVIPKFEIVVVPKDESTPNNTQVAS